MHGEVVLSGRVGVRGDRGANLFLLIIELNMILRNDSNLNTTSSSLLLLRLSNYCLRRIFRARDCRHFILVGEGICTGDIANLSHTFYRTIIGTVFNPILHFQQLLSRVLRLRLLFFLGGVHLKFIIRSKISILHVHIVYGFFMRVNLSEILVGKVCFMLHFG